MFSVQLDSGLDSQSPHSALSHPLCLASHHTWSLQVRRLPLNATTLSIAACSSRNYNKFNLSSMSASSNLMEELMPYVQSFVLALYVKKCLAANVISSVKGLAYFCMLFEQSTKWLGRKFRRFN